MSEETRRNNLLPTTIDIRGRRRTPSFEQLMRLNSHLGANYLQSLLQSLVDKSAVNNPMLRDNPTLCGTNRLALTSTSASQHARHHHDTALPLTTDLLIGAQTGAVWPRASQTRTAARVARTRLVRTCIGHAYPAFCGVFDRTSQRMITGADDKLVKVWSTRTGALQVVLRGHVAPVADIAVSHDNTMVASGDSKGTIRVWSLIDYRPLAVLLGHNTAISNLQFSPDDSFLLSAAIGCVVRIWPCEDDFSHLPVIYHRTVATVPHRSILRPTPHNMRETVSTPRHQTPTSNTTSSVAAASNTSNATIDYSTASTSRTASRPVTNASKHGLFRIYDDDDDDEEDANNNTDVLVDVGQYTPLKSEPFVDVVSAPPTTPKSPPPSRPSNNTLLSTPPPPGNIRTIPSSPASPGDGFRRDQEFDLSSPDAVLPEVSFRPDPPTTNTNFPAIAFGLNGKLLAISGQPRIQYGGASRPLRVGRSSAIGRSSTIIESDDDQPDKQAMDTDDAEPLGPNDYVVRLWSTDTNRCIAELRGHRGPVICSRFAPSNRAVLATGGEDGTVRLWHFGSVLKDSGVQGVHENDWRVLHIPSPINRGNTLRVVSLIWADGDRYIVVAYSDDVIRVYNSETGLLVHELVGHQADIELLAESPLESRIFASGSYDGHVILWDAVTGRELYRTPRFDYDLDDWNKILDVSWSHNGSMFMFTDVFGSTRLFSNAPYDDIAASRFPDEQFTATENDPLNYDRARWCLDENTRLPPHMLPRGPLITFHGTPYDPNQYDTIGGIESPSTRTHREPLPTLPSYPGLLRRSGAERVLNDIRALPAVSGGVLAAVLGDRNERRTMSRGRPRTRGRPRRQPIYLDSPPTSDDDANDNVASDDESVDIDEDDEDDDEDEDDADTSSSVTGGRRLRRRGASNNAYRSRTRSRQASFWQDEPQQPPRVQRHAAVAATQRNQVLARTTLSSSLRPVPTSQRTLRSAIIEPSSDSEAEHHNSTVNNSTNNTISNDQRAYLPNDGESFSSVDDISNNLKHAVFSAWQSYTETPPAGVYVPQRGDDVLYFARAHQKFARHFHNPEKVPCTYTPNWPEVVRCRVIAIVYGALKNYRYVDLLLEPIVGGDDGDAKHSTPLTPGEDLPLQGANGPSRGKLRALREFSTLSLIDKNSNAGDDNADHDERDKVFDVNYNGTQAPEASAFVVRHVPCANTTEYLVLTSQVRQACAQSLRAGDRKKTWFADRMQFYKSTVQKLLTLRECPADTQRLVGDHRSLWDCCLTEFDRAGDESGYTESLSPWELQPTDDDDAGNNAAEASTRTTAVPHIARESPRSIYERNVLMQDVPGLEMTLAELMQESIAKSFTEPVDLEHYDNYTDHVSAPMDLTLIRCRLTNGYYRRISSVLDDIALMVYSSYQFNGGIRDVTVHAVACYERVRQCVDATFRATLQHDEELRAPEIKNRRKELIQSIVSKFEACLERVKQQRAVQKDLFTAAKAADKLLTVRPARKSVGNNKKQNSSLDTPLTQRSSRTNVNNTPYDVASPLSVAGTASEMFSSPPANKNNHNDDDDDIEDKHLKIAIRLSLSQLGSTENSPVINKVQQRKQRNAKAKAKRRGRRTNNDSDSDRSRELSGSINRVVADDDEEAVDEESESFELIHDEEDDDKEQDYDDDDDDDDVSGTLSADDDNDETVHQQARKRGHSATRSSRTNNNNNDRKSKRVKAEPKKTPKFTKSKPAMPRRAAAARSRSPPTTTNTNRSKRARTQTKRLQL